MKHALATLRGALAVMVFLTLANGAVACGGSDEAQAGAKRLHADPPTFSRDVAPIVFQNCAPCHRPGGSAPFPLLTYEDVQGHGPQVADITEARVMPPWLPARPAGVFANERRLTEDEIDLLRRWVEAGMPEGGAEELPSRPEWPEGWYLGEPDLVVEAAEPYSLEPGDEVFRNFVLPVPLSEAMWIEAVELKPGSAKVVHHATLLLDRTHSSRRLDDRDPGPGFDGMTPNSAVERPAGFFLGWTPGKLPARNPPGIAWRLEPGTDFVLQLHLRPIETAVEVRPRIGLFFAQGPPERIPVVLQLGSESLDIPAGADSFVVEDSFVLPVEVEVLGLYPHAHYLAREMRVWAERPNGDTEWLLHILEWDFDWQDEYRYAEPLSLRAGTTLRMRYTYDNSATNPRNPSRPPRHVAFGPHSTDEMADLAIQVLPRTHHEATLLTRTISKKVLDTKIDGFRRALERDPEDTTVLNNLGIALHRMGDLDEAIRHYRRALEVDSGDAHVHHNLAAALQTRGAIDEALGHYRQAVRLDPDLAPAHRTLGDLLARRGSLPEAIAHYERALESEPHDARTYQSLGFALGGTGRIGEALAHFREAARLRPTWTAPLMAMAELLAEHPDPEVRRPQEAVALAERAAELSDHQDPAVLLVLAAAQASAGQLDEAIETAERALAMAEAGGVDRLAARIRERLERYRREGP